MKSSKLPVTFDEFLYNQFGEMSTQPHKRMKFKIKKKKERSHMGPTPPVMQSLAVTDNDLPQKKSYASALKDSKKLYEKGDLIYVTVPEGMPFESYMMDSIPLGRPGLVVDVHESDGTLSVYYPVKRKKLLLHVDEVTKVTHFKDDDDDDDDGVMVVIDRCLIMEYQGIDAIKYCGKHGTIEEVIVYSWNEKEFIVEIDGQKVKFNQVCLMPIPSEVICAICRININNISLKCHPKHQICSQCLPKLPNCPFCREPI